MVTNKDTRIDRNKLKPYNGASTKILFTNGDQMNAAKVLELQQHINCEKPLIVAICEVKPKNSVKERTTEDFQIPDYELHPVNLHNTDPGRGVAIYTHSSISRLSWMSSSKKHVLLKFVYGEGRDTLLFACCYRSPTKSS